MDVFVVDFVYVHDFVMTIDQCGDLILIWGFGATGSNSMHRLESSRFFFFLPSERLEGAGCETNTNGSESSVPRLLCRCPHVFFQPAPMTLSVVGQVIHPPAKIDFDRMEKIDSIVVNYTIRYGASLCWQGCFSYSKAVIFSDPKYNNSLFYVFGTFHPFDADGSQRQQTK